MPIRRPTAESAGELVRHPPVDHEPPHKRRTLNTEPAVDRIDELTRAHALLREIPTPISLVRVVPDGYGKRVPFLDRAIALGVVIGIDQCVCILHGILLDVQVHLDSIARSGEDVMRIRSSP